jgi:aryl-alcohol dehydrogenase-like predicted oxidoreductase
VIASYFGHLDFTKEHNDSVSFINRLFSKPREIDREKIEPLFKVMDEIANAHGKSLAQVAINWLLSTEDICIVPIPGMKNIQQVNDNIGALGWKITKEERNQINNAMSE